MTSPAVQFDQLDSVPLAVIRRHASASELSRVVPQCCGLVWNAVRAQQARAGATSPSIGTAAFAWKSGWSCMDRLPRRGRSSVPPRPLAPWHGQRISGLIAAWARARRSSPVVSSQQSPTCWSKLGDIRPLAKRMEYESIADSNRCLLPADLLTPAGRGRVGSAHAIAIAGAFARCGSPSVGRGPNFAHARIR